MGLYLEGGTAIESKKNSTLDKHTFIRCNSCKMLSHITKTKICDMCGKNYDEENP